VVVGLAAVIAIVRFFSSDAASNSASATRLGGSRARGAAAGSPSRASHREGPRRLGSDDQMRSRLGFTSVTSLVIVSSS
jgi:hypothetical protein